MSDQFKEMCIASEELRKLWKPKIGDKYYLTKNIDEIRYDGYSETVYKEGFYVIGEPFGKPWQTKYDTFPTSFDIIINDVKKNSVWCPTQEDLQKILLNNKKEYSPYLAMMSFWDYFKEIDLKILGIINENHNLTVAWLCFVEEKCFSKFWNCEKKKWELIR